MTTERTRNRELRAGLADTAMRVNEFSEISLEEMLVLMEKTETTQSKKDQLKDYENGVLRTKILSQLRSTYETMDVKIDEEILNQTVDNHLAKKYVELTRKPLFSRIYDNRKKVGIVAGVISLALSIPIGFELASRSIEYATEQKVLSLDQKLREQYKELEFNYSRINSIAKESDVLDRVTAMYSSGKKAISERNTEDVQGLINDLKSVREKLDLEYRVIITGGRWRYQSDNPSIKNYYLLLEQQGTDGKLIPKTIRNEETGNLETVSKWGERVPESVYILVRKDNEDNGFVDNKLFGNKKRGYLEEEVTFVKPYSDLGQIAKW